MPSFCLNRIRPLVRVRPPTIQSKNISISTSATTTSAYKSNLDPEEKEKEKKGNGGINGSSVDDDEEEEKAAKVVVIGRKIMIVVDSSAEAKNALQWALTHTVQSQDMVILLYVSKSSNPPHPAGCIFLFFFHFSFLFFLHQVEGSIYIYIWDFFCMQ